MGRPTTLLEGLCGHALSLGAQSIEVEYKDRREWVFASKEGKAIGIANYASSSTDGKELRSRHEVDTIAVFIRRSFCTGYRKKRPLR